MFPYAAPRTHLAILVLCLLAAGVRASAADIAEKTVTETVDLGGCGSVAIVVPVDFTVTKSPAMPGAASAKAVSMHRKVSLQMTFLIPPKEKLPDETALASGL